MNKKIFIILFLICLVSACGTWDEDWMIRGDSMAYRMGEPAALPGKVVNGSYGETTIKGLRTQRLTGFKKVILFAGYDTLKNEDAFVDEIILDYILLVLSIESEKTYCVAVPNFKKDEKIAAFNAGIRPVCADGFIDTDALIFDEEGNLLPGMTDDNIYPGAHLYDLIVQAILNKEN